MNQVKNIARPMIYISQQHGALITIISVNLMSILHSDKIAVFQIFAFLFSLSVFHVGEIYFLPKRVRAKEINWLITYLLSTIICGAFIVTQQPQIVILLSGLFLLSGMFFILKNKTETKAIFYFVSFALLIWVSLFSISTQSPKLLFNLYLQLLIYFSFTVALINWRLGKLPLQIINYTLIASLVMCLLIHDWKGILALTGILSLRWLLFTFTKTYWVKAPLKVFGYQETLFLSAYIFLMTLI